MKLCNDFFYTRHHKTNSFASQNKNFTRSSKKDDNPAIIDLSSQRKKDEKFEIRIGNLEDPQYMKMLDDIEKDENQRKRFVNLLEKFKSSQQVNDA
jgi:hypothetical protein